jgi:hypothetical protein
MKARSNLSTDSKYSSDSFHPELTSSCCAALMRARSQLRQYRARPPHLRIPARPSFGAPRQEERHRAAASPLEPPPRPLSRRNQDPTRRLHFADHLRKQVYRSKQQLKESCSNLLTCFNNFPIQKIERRI